MIHGAGFQNATARSHLPECKNLHRFQGPWWVPGPGSIPARMSRELSEESRHSIPVKRGGGRIEPAHCRQLPRVEANYPFVTFFKDIIFRIVIFRIVVFSIIVFSIIVFNIVVFNIVVFRTFKGSLPEPRCARLS